MKAPKTAVPHRMCALPPQREVTLPSNLAPGREFAIRLVRNKWVNGTVLRFNFVEESAWPWPENQKTVVREAFQTWKSLGIGLDFVEVSDRTEAELRIGFDQNDGSWSYVGTDVLHNEFRGRTMNFGWDLTTEWGKATALHEIGHALGMPHEHQNPMSGIVWNETAVIAAFSGYPNYWKEPDIRHNILRKISRGEVEGSTWDPHSIMHYPFEPGMISAPKPYDTDGVAENTTLSARDKAWMVRFYPPLSAPAAIDVMELMPLGNAVGDQRDYVFKPDATREYTVQTVGKSDSKVVLFEVRGGEPRHFSAADDSGLDANAALTTKLVKGRDYIIRVRTHFVPDATSGGLLIS
ncbi:M12 family metallopeptidase [Brevundimonas sp. R86498]|uniref:M12 family metallopeptidase n=1 Tax=Brevundimonas sp. R86498 TaxID=3093845 RepID=UPI0037C7C016